jgi:putative ABC transport system permease protein
VGVVTSNFLPLLCTRLTLGRFFGPEDETSFLHLIGRLRNGSNLASGQAEADAIAAHIHAFDGRSGITNFRLYVFSLQADDVRAVRGTLLLLFGGVAFVLVMGCANVANLLMARATRRLRETITRAALGASRGRLVRNS